MSRYTESAVLKVEDAASAQLAKINRNFGRFVSNIDRLNAKMAAGKGAIGGPAGNALAAGIRAQQRALEQATRSADRYAGAMRAAAAASVGMASAAKASQAVQRAQARAMNASTGTLGAGRAGRGAAGHGGGVAGALAFGGGALVGAKIAHMVVHAAEVALHGAKEYSTAQERTYQAGFTGAETTEAQMAAKRISAQFQTISEAKALGVYADISPFTHDSKTRELVTSRIAQQAALMQARGEASGDFEKKAGQLVKGLDLLGVLKPDAKTHEVDTSKFNKMFDAYAQVAAIEGRNIRPEDLKYLGTYLGAGAQSMTPEGIQRALLYATDVGGKTAATQTRAFTDAMYGTIRKKAIPGLIENGFMEANGKGGYRMTDERAYQSNPLLWMAERPSTR